MHRGTTLVALTLLWMQGAAGTAALNYAGRNLDSIPKEVFEAKDLRTLNLGSNQLEMLPDSIGSLKQLQELYLYRNQLKALPDSIGVLKQLQKLYLHYNKLKGLPDSIGSLEQLEELSLGSNQLKGLPNSIGSLEKLQKLYLYRNKLKALPDSIGDLTQLQRLYLGSNRLTALPRTILGIQSLTLLRLEGNNSLVERGVGETLGWRDLREHLGDIVVLSQDRLAGPITVIHVDDVYTRLRNEPVHWNIERLKNIRVSSIPKHTRSAHELIGIWNGSLAKYAPHITDGRDMERYIQTLYGVDEKAFQGWRMYPESQTATQDLLEAVLVKLEDSPESAETYVPELSEALKWCPDRQIACLTMVYAALHGTQNTGTFEYFVENRIGVLKSYILDMVVTPSRGTQNVHVRNTWRHRLRDILGVEGEYESRMGTFGQDMYGGQVGNVLDVFFRKFTPSYVIDKLREEINESERRVGEAGAILHRRLDDEEYARSVFEYESERDMEYMVPKGIREKGVEDILLEMGILEKRTEKRRTHTWAWWSARTCVVT